MKTLLTALLCACSAAAQVKLPEYSREVLPNGVVLYLAPQPGLPLVHFRVAVRGGTESEPPRLAGLASVTAELLRRGAGMRSADQFSETLDSLGGTFGASADDQATHIEAEFLKKDADSGIALLADAIFRPAFPEPEVKKALAQRLDAVKAARDDPQSAIAPYWRAFFFGPNHPYGRPADEASLDRIKRQDVVDYHKRHFTGRNLAVVVTGDFDPTEMKNKLAAAFGAAPPGTAYGWSSPVAPAASGPRLLLVDKPDATQTYFRVGTPGVNRTHPDRVALQLVNTVFGGRFTSMLNDELRVNSSLTYGAGSTVQMSRLPGAILISTFTKTETTGKAIDLALDILARLRDKGLTADQLESAKAYYKGTFPPRQLETIDQVAERLLELEIFGLERGEVDGLFQRIDSVTLEQANAAARRHYRNDNLTFVLVGSAEKIRGSVKKYAPAIAERAITKPGWGD